MRVAAEIQRGLLPRRAPSVPGYDVVGSNTPCRTVGGDYYDFELDGSRLLIALGDVSGKGTGAALLMTVLRASVRGHWTEGAVADAIGRINSTVCQNVTAGKYVTFFLARLEPETGRITYVNAGHNPPLLARADGSLETLTEGGMVLGLFESVPYDEGTTVLGRGDVLVIYSDGVTETFTADEDEFGDARLAELVTRERGCGASALQQRILDAIESFAAGAKATDDRTLIVVKRET
jgi:serine phosphatase RsbU (regulator of sigma subunit)